MPVSKFFSIACEGATTDGRQIQRSWLEQAAKNFDPKKYGARVNLEHYLSIVPDSTFRAYGDVIELKTEERDSKLHLLAKVDATEELVALHKSRQKIYSSIELNTKFAETGEAYLVGLAMTDTPASLGTEIMQFAAQASENPFASRKQHPENLFTAAVAAELEFMEATEPENPGKAGGENDSFLEKIKALFSKAKDASGQELGALKADLENAILVIAKTAAQKTDAGEFAHLKSAHDALKIELSELKATLDRQPATEPMRSQATGTTQTKTDC